jgi:hypothetical protein
MLELLAMAEHLIGGVRRGCCPPGIALPPHVGAAKPASYATASPAGAAADTQFPVSPTAWDVLTHRQIAGSISKTRRRERLPEGRRGHQGRR